MQNKKTLIIVSGLLLFGIITAAYLFSSGILLKGEVPPPPPPPDDIVIPPLATDEELLDNIANDNLEPVDDAIDEDQFLDPFDGTPGAPDPDEPVDDAIDENPNNELELLDVAPGVPDPVDDTPEDPEPEIPVGDALLLDGYDAPLSAGVDTPDEPVNDAQLLDGYDAPPSDAIDTPDEPINDAQLLDGYDAPPSDAIDTPDEPVNDALLLDGFDAPPSDVIDTPEEPVDDALYSVADEIDVPDWLASTDDDTKSDTQPTTVETIIIKETIIATPEAPEDEPPCGFEDIEKDDPDCAAFLWIKSKGAMTGVDGNFLPKDLLQRDQIIKVVGMTFDLFGQETTYCQEENPFPDVNNEDWACEYIFNAKDADVAEGYGDGTFKSARFVNRAEFLAFVIRNLEHETVGATTYTDIPEEAWYKIYASYAYDHSLFEGEELNPNNFTSRREVAKVLFKLHSEGLIE